MELTGIHNRRANIKQVSKRAKEHGYPLLVWPEDKELLRLEDIPDTRQEPNKPTDWVSITLSRIIRHITENHQLRFNVGVRKAYTRNGSTVYEYTIQTIPVKR